MVRNSVEGFTKIEKKKTEQTSIASRVESLLAFMRERKKSSGSRFSCSKAPLAR